MSAAIDDSLRERHLALPGTYNVRDLGGLPAATGVTRSGVFLRGDSLHKLDDRGRAMLAEAGVRTVIDLRDERERTSCPSALTAETRIIELPLLADTPSIPLADDWRLGELYVWFGRQCGGQIAAVARELARPDALPALVHCMAGKDRTGIVVAIVLSAVGVPDDVVAADFAISAALLGEEFRRETRERAPQGDHVSELGDWVFESNAEDILAALRSIGDCGEYLVAHGLGREELEALRGALVE